jgi:hypothetical protein
VTGVEFLDDSIVCVTTNDSRIRFINTFRARVVLKLKGHKNIDYMIKAGMSWDRKFLICASDDGHCYFWNNVVARVTDMNKKGLLENVFTSNKVVENEHFNCTSNFLSVVSGQSSSGALTAAVVGPDSKIIVCNIHGGLQVYNFKLR